jgi:hypothetical protein
MLLLGRVVVLQAQTKVVSERKVRARLARLRLDRVAQGHSPRVLAPTPLLHTRHGLARCRMAQAAHKPD